MEGEHGVRTRIITAYAPVGGKDSGPKSYWRQHVRYIENNSLNTNPFKMFCDDLCEVLTTWRSKGDRIILMMDANDNVFNGKLSKRLAEEPIGMKEAVHGLKHGQGPSTHFRNTKSVPIDGIWHTPEIQVRKASYLPFDFVVGDHRPVVVDFSQASILGVNLPRVVASEARRLNSKIDRVREAYIDRLEESFQESRILERLREIKRTATYPLSKEAADALEKIDKEMEAQMLYAEKSVGSSTPTTMNLVPRCRSG